jgi:hypothetical protein
MFYSYRALEYSTIIASLQWSLFIYNYPILVVVVSEVAQLGTGHSIESTPLTLIAYD